MSNREITTKNVLHSFHRAGHFRYFNIAKRELHHSSNRILRIVMTQAGVKQSQFGALP